MSLWLVRAGKHGEQEQAALDGNFVTIGWNELGDLSKCRGREDLADVYAKAYPSAKERAAANEVGQLLSFVTNIQKGDLVALPLKKQSAIALGRIAGDYQYKKLSPGIKHIRPVAWLKTIPRSSFDQDLLFSLGAFMTVCRIERNDAENRVRTMLKRDGGSDQPDEAVVNVEELANDQVIRHIAATFKGHGLSRAITAILQAQGYVTEESPPGPDGGVDIVAATGPLGFGSPRVCVQVKSSTSSVDVKVLRELQGVMQKVRADQGLLVSWGGFTGPALKEAKDAFFTMRLWDQGEIVREIFRNYEKLDDEIKAELPLKRVWALVLDEQQSV